MSRLSLTVDLLFWRVPFRNAPFADGCAVIVHGRAAFFVFWKFIFGFPDGNHNSWLCAVANCAAHSFFVEVARS